MKAAHWTPRSGLEPHGKLTAAGWRRRVGGGGELEGGKFDCCKVQVFTRRKVCRARSSYYFCIKEPRASHTG